MVKTVEVFVPTAELKIKKMHINPRVHDLNEKVVGFLWNEKPNADFLLQRLRDQLLQRYKLAGIEWGQVAALHVGAEGASEVKQLAATADTVIIAVGDWGACTTWCIHAAVALEKRGKPTVTICTNRFEVLARVTATGLGMSNLPLVVVSHPIGGISPEEVKGKADSMLDNLITQLLG